MQVHIDLMEVSEKFQKKLSVNAYSLPKLLGELNMPESKALRAEIQWIRREEWSSQRSIEEQAFLDQQSLK